MLDRESSLTLAMKVLANLLPDEVETDDFYWNLYGTDQDLPNFWWKHTNLQVEWYRDDPGRAGFANFGLSADESISLLMQVRESYDLRDK